MEGKAERRKRISAAFLVFWGLVVAAGVVLGLINELTDPELWIYILVAAAGLSLLIARIADRYAIDWLYNIMAAVFLVVLVSAVVVAAINCGSDGPRYAPERIEKVLTGHHPRAIAASSDDIWVVGLDSSKERGMLWRIDPEHLSADGEEIEPFEATDPYDIAINKRAIWVTDDELLIKLDLNGREIWRKAMGDGGDNEVDVRFGKVWFKETSSGKLFVLDPATGERTRPPVNVGPEAIAIAAGLGSVWVSSWRGDSPVVVRVDRAGKVVGKIRVQEDPQDLVAGRHHVYVAHGEDELVTRIDPGAGAYGEEIPGEIPLDKATGPPGGIDAGGRTVWIPFAGSGNAFAIAECSAKALGRAHSGNSPYDVVVRGGKAFVPNSGEGTVSVFQLKQPACAGDS